MLWAVGADMKIRTFHDADEDAELALRAEHISAWAPSNQMPGCTVVQMISGKTHRITLAFKEFHEWMCGAPVRPSPPVGASDVKVNKRDLNGTTRR